VVHQKHIIQTIQYPGCWECQARFQRSGLLAAIPSSMHSEIDFGGVVFCLIRPK
jgi:hypothetical protein